MTVVQITTDFITYEEWPYPKLPCVKIWKGFAQQLLRYGQKGKSKQGQGHSLRSSVKVTKFQSALHLLLVNKGKKSEDNAITRFCCSVRNSKSGGEKNPTATSSITILTESTSRSITSLRSYLFNVYHTFINNMSI